jgi:hypothetical protein
MNNAEPNISSRATPGSEILTEAMSLLQRLRDRLDGVFDEVLAQAVMKRRARDHGRPRLVRSGVRS